MDRVSISAPLRPGQRRRPRVSLAAVHALGGDQRADQPPPSRDPARPRREPSLRYLVRVARRCETAAQLAEALKQRYAARQEGRPTDAIERELDQLERRLLGSRER